MRELLKQSGAGGNLNGLCCLPRDPARYKEKAK